MGVQKSRLLPLCSSLIDLLFMFLCILGGHLSDVWFLPGIFFVLATVTQNSIGSDHVVLMVCCTLCLSFMNKDNSIVCPYSISLFSFPTNLLPLREFPWFPSLKDFGPGGNRRIAEVLRNGFSTSSSGNLPISHRTVSLWMSSLWRVLCLRNGCFWETSLSPDYL